MTFVRIAKRQKYLNQNHGSYREIKEEDFLQEVTSSEWVVVHFYHHDFTRCKIADKHLEVYLFRPNIFLLILYLQILAKNYVETKFLTIDVEKAPFFVTKLQVKVLPAIILFNNGNVVDRYAYIPPCHVLIFTLFLTFTMYRIVGFDELGGADTFKTDTLARRIARAGTTRLPLYLPSLLHFIRCFET